MPEVTKTEEELQFTVKGLSPVMIAWKSLESGGESTEIPSDESTETPSDESTEIPSDESTKRPSNGSTEISSDEATTANTINKPDKKPEPPATKDSRESKIWLILLALSVAELTAVYYSIRKNKQH